MMRQDRRSLLDHPIFSTQLKVDKILEVLIAKQVLNNDNCDMINSRPTECSKRKEVIKAVQRRGDVAFDAFYDALRDTEHDELADVLKPLARTIESSFNLTDFECPMSPASHRRSRAMSPTGYTSPTRVHRDSISSISSFTSTYQDVYSRARSTSRSSRALHASDRHNYTSPVNSFPSQPSSANSSFTGCSSLGYSSSRTRSFSKASAHSQYIFHEEEMNYVDAPTINRIFDEKTMYRNFSRPRGLCLIINNEHFENMPTRNGTKADKDNITNLFKCMGYTVFCKENLTGRGMLLTIREFAKNDMHGDSAILVILSHGEENVIYGVDVPVNIHELYDLLNATNAPRLANKPKLVFVQACRGERRDAGFPVLDSTDGVSVVRRGWDNRDGPLFNFLGCVRPQAQQIWRKKPSQADMLIAYATTAQYVSWRNSARGSWFIQAVCEVFSTHAKDMDVVELLTEVNKKVACGFQTSQGANILKQMPELTSRLLKKFYFWPEARNSAV